MTRISLRGLRKTRKWQTFDPHMVKLCSYNFLVRQIFLLSQLRFHTVLAVVTDDSPVGDLITTNGDPEYKHCFLKALLKGEFRESDVRFNNIFDADSVAAPKFVMDHEDILSQKRKLAPEVLCLHILCFFAADK
jgi:hypothetical protein